jgi:hypothetical protein
MSENLGVSPTTSSWGPQRNRYAALLTFPGEQLTEQSLPAQSGWAKNKAATGMNPAAPATRVLK